MIHSVKYFTFYLFTNKTMVVKIHAIFIDQIVLFTKKWIFLLSIIWRYHLWEYFIFWHNCYASKILVIHHQIVLFTKKVIFPWVCQDTLFSSTTKVVEEAQFRLTAHTLWLELLYVCAPVHLYKYSIQRGFESKQS